VKYASASGRSAPARNMSTIVRYSASNRASSASASVRACCSAPARWRSPASFAAIGMRCSGIHLKPSHHRARLVDELERLGVVVVTQRGVDHLRHQLEPQLERAIFVHGGLDLVLETRAPLFDVPCRSDRRASRSCPAHCATDRSCRRT
jgi:hypothetical protein